LYKQTRARPNQRRRGANKNVWWEREDTSVLALVHDDAEKCSCNETVRRAAMHFFVIGFGGKESKLAERSAKRLSYL